MFEPKLADTKCRDSWWSGQQGFTSGSQAGERDTKRDGGHYKNWKKDRPKEKRHFWCPKVWGKPVWQLNHVQEVRTSDKTSMLLYISITTKHLAIQEGRIPNETPNQIPEDRKRKKTQGVTCKEKTKESKWSLKENRRAEEACRDGKLKEKLRAKQGISIMSSFLMRLCETTAALSSIQSELWYKTIQPHSMKTQTEYTEKTQQQRWLLMMRNIHAEGTQKVPERLMSGSDYTILARLWDDFVVWFCTSVMVDREQQSSVYTRVVLLNDLLRSVWRTPRHPDQKTSMSEFFLPWLI